MNTAEARLVLAAELARFRHTPYATLVSLIQSPESYEVEARSGEHYQVEIQAAWDDPKKPNQVLRVTGAIDDGGLRAYSPVTDGFRMAPSGKCIG